DCFKRSLASTPRLSNFVKNCRPASDNVCMKNEDANAAKNQPYADVRLDVWLWSARFFKTRSLAKKAIEHNNIRLNGAPVRASTHVRIGDALSIERGDEQFGVVVAGIESRRGSAPMARRMYAETEESRLA